MNYRFNRNTPGSLLYLASTQVKLILVAGACLLGLSFGAMAQTTVIPDVTSTSTGGSGSVTLTGLPTTTTSDASFAFTVNGDLNDVGEFITVTLDGTTIGTVGGFGTGFSTQCMDLPDALTVPQAVLAPLIADGSLIIGYQAESSVNSLSGSPPVDCGGRSFSVSGTVTYTGPPTAPTADAVSANTQFLANRARSLVQNQPDVVRFVDGRIGGAFSAEVSQGRGVFDLSTVAAGPVWGAIQGSFTDTDFGDQEYYLGAFGAHFQVGKNAVVGAMLQFDYAEDTLTDGTETSGNGWLIGPYFATQIGDQQLFAEGRLLYGQTDNETSTPGGASGDFDGDRWLASLGLEGRWDQAGYTLLPGVDVSYVRDEQDAYVDSAATAVAAQSISYTDVALGMGIEVPLDGPAAGFIVTGGVAGIWSDTRQTLGGAALTTFDDGVRGRLDLGFRYDGGKGLQSTANVFVDGLGSGDATTVGATLGVFMSF